MQLEIATGFYQSVSLPLAAQRCINWEPIVPQASALNQRALRDVYGVDTRALTGSTIAGINRGAQVVSGVPYFINERSLYSFTEAGVVTNHGVINGSGRVSLANNGQYLVIVVPGVTAYVFNNLDSAAISAVVADGGTGYTVDDDITVVGNTGDAAVFNVDTVSGGIVTSVSVVTAGNALAKANNPVATTGGTGAGCTLTVSYATTLTEIDDLDFQVSDTVSFKDGFFIFTNSAGTQFFVSNLNQPLVYSALDFGSAEVRPDKIVAVAISPQNELLVFGEEIIEQFQNVGGADFPFEQTRGSTIAKGLRARFSVVEFDNTLVFVGGAVGELSSIWQLGGRLKKISTSAIDNVIQEYTAAEIADAFAFTYAYGGNFFAAFTFESTRIPSRTLVYDATSSTLSGDSVWHERQSGVVGSRWRVASILSAYGDLIVADSVDGRIGTLNKDTHTEYGDPIFRQKVSSPFQIDQLHIFVSELKLTMESGQGVVNSTDDGFNPQISMEYSDDGARTWSNPSLRSYGKIGEYEKIPSWRRQGRVPRARVLRFTTTEPIKSTLIRLDAFGEPAVEI